MRPICDSPRTSQDLERFENDLRASIEVGANIGRSVFMSGRRYEVFFRSLDEFQKFKREAEASLALAEPILAKHQFRLAVENHKDFLVEEQLAIIRRIDSPWISVLVDTGNNLALLEEPYSSIDALAPLQQVST